MDVTFKERQERIVSTLEIGTMFLRDKCLFVVIGNDPDGSYNGSRQVIMVWTSHHLDPKLHKLQTGFSWMPPDAVVKVVKSLVVEVV